MIKTLRLTASTGADYDVELESIPDPSAPGYPGTWERYILARKQGRLHLDLDEAKRVFVMAEELKVDPTEKKGKDWKILDHGKVIIMGTMKPSTGDVDNVKGLRTR